MHTLFCRYLSSLGIAHTASYSDMRYRTMPFHTLFGLASLLEEYDAACTGLRISDKSRMGSLPLPYLAQYKGEMVIVERYDNDPATGEISRITIDRDGKRLSLSRERFESGWSGIALFCEKRTDSREPDLAKHRLAEWISAAKTIALFGCLLFLILAVWIRGPLVGNAGAWCALILNIWGIIVSRWLMLKSHAHKSAAADHVCGMMQAHGCDTVLANKASTLFGIVSWGEVGMAYFSVSAFTLIAFPEALRYLALLNACCLPFTIWSVTYQKVVIKSWCTLCLTVQATLWLLFGSYLLAGAWHDLLPLGWSLWLLLAAYIAATLGLNRLSSLFNPANHV